MTFDEYKLFIIRWCCCETLDDFLDVSGMDARSASNVASALRRKGVKLKRMPTGTGGTTWKVLSTDDWQRLRILAENEANAEAVRCKYRG